MFCTLWAVSPPITAHPTGLYSFYPGFSLFAVPQVYVLPSVQDVEGDFPNVSVLPGVRDAEDDFINARTCEKASEGVLYQNPKNPKDWYVCVKQQDGSLKVRVGIFLPTFSSFVKIYCHILITLNYL